VLPVPPLTRGVRGDLRVKKTRPSSVGAGFIAVAKALRSLSPSAQFTLSPSTQFTLSEVEGLRVNCVEWIRINSVEMSTSTTLSDRKYPNHLGGCYTNNNCRSIDNLVNPPPPNPGPCCKGLRFCAEFTRHERSKGPE